LCCCDGEDFNEEEETEAEELCENLFEEYLEECMSPLPRDFIETPLKDLWARFYEKGFTEAELVIDSEEEV